MAAVPSQRTQSWEERERAEAQEREAGARPAELLLALQRAERENTRLMAANAALREANRRLQAQAATDDMTGLPNHRRFRERLREEVARYRRLRAPLALLMVDVDHFKAYNDTYGHPAGDAALRLVARLIRQSVRDVDMAARYGGEEFAVLLPATDTTAALRVAERIRTAVEAHRFPHRAVTVSIGVSELSLAEESARALIAAADGALYAAKRDGRNRVALTA